MIFMKVNGSIILLIMQIIMEMVIIMERMNMLVTLLIGVTEK